MKQLSYDYEVFLTFYKIYYFNYYLQKIALWQIHSQLKIFEVARYF